MSKELGISPTFIAELSSYRHSILKGIFSSFHILVKRLFVYTGPNFDYGSSTKLCHVPRRNSNWECTWRSGSALTDKWQRFTGGIVKKPESLPLLPDHRLHLHLRETEHLPLRSTSKRVFLLCSSLRNGDRIPFHLCAFLFDPVLIFDRLEDKLSQMERNYGSHA